MAKAYSMDTEIERSFMATAAGAYYVVNKDAAKRHAERFYANPKPEVARVIWNILDSKLYSSMFDMTLLTIRCNKLIYVPRCTSHVLDPNGNSSTSSGNPKFLFTDPGNATHVPIRVLCPLKISALEETKDFLFEFCCRRETKGVVSHVSNRVIFHIHGGGFIAMTSHAH
jgi:hypothetical protein